MENKDKNPLEEENGAELNSGETSGLTQNEAEEASLCISDNTSEITEQPSVDCNDGGAVDSKADVKPGEPAKAKAKTNKKKKGVPFVIRMVLMAVFTSVFVISVFMIISNILDGFAANKAYSDMSNDFFEGMDRTGSMDYLAPMKLDSETPSHGKPRKTLADESIEIIETNNPFFKQFKEKLTEYKKTNPDIYGWIQVDGTNISYPCVKGTDNAYYLDHTATLEKNVNGAIFADYRCSMNVLDNKNLVFYGHNMIYPAQMFHELTKFLDATFFKNNRYVTIYTLDGVYRYEVFAIYQTISTYRYCQLSFLNDRLFGEWCAEMKSNSLYTADVGEFTAESKILTLSTCTNGVQTDRYALQAKLVAIEK